MKLIDFPLCSIHSPIFCKIKNSFRVSSDLDSKAVHTTEITKFKTYFLLEIEDSVSIIGSTNTIHQYGIVDFYIPPEEGATDYLSNFYHVLLNNDDYDVRTKVDHPGAPNQICLDGIQKFYPPPDISLVKICNNLPGVNIFGKSECIKNHVVKFDWDSDQVPLMPVLEYQEYLSKGAFYFKAMAFLNHLLSEQPIICKLDIERKKKYIESLGMTQTCVYTHLPLLAYYSAYGPWLRCWVRFGFDPRTDYKSYKFQRLSKFRIKLHFLYQDPDLLSIIEKNEDKFIKSTWDKETGFFKQDLIMFIKRREKGSKIEYFTGN